MFGDGDCGQLGLGEEVTERLRPFPVSVDGKKVSPGGAAGWWSLSGGTCRQMLHVAADQPATACLPPASPNRGSSCASLGPQPQPSPCPSNHSKQVLQIACGGMHTVALTEDRRIFSWGVNDEGALGRETGTQLMLLLQAAAAGCCQLPPAAVCRFCCPLSAGNALSYGLQLWMATRAWHSYRSLQLA